MEELSHPCQVSGSAWKEGEKILGARGTGYLHQNSVQCRLEMIE